MMTAAKWVWLSVDPKAYAFPSVSPYTFNMNNPVMFIDPGGDSTYSLNSEGRITAIDGNQYYNESGQAVDRIFSEDNPDSDIYITEGVVSSRSSRSDRDVYMFRDNDQRDEAERFYYWAADNSEVEWAFARGKENGAFGGVVGTNHRSGETSLVHLFEGRYGKYIDLVSHSHPSGGGPSYDNQFLGKKGKYGDLNNAKTGVSYQYEVYGVGKGIIYGYSSMTLDKARRTGVNYDYTR